VSPTTTGWPRFQVRPTSAESSVAGILSHLVNEIRWHWTDIRPLVRILHVTARLGREVIRTALGLLAQFDVTGTPGALGEALILVEKQIRYVNVGRVSCVYRRDRLWGATIRADSHVVVVIIIDVDRGARGNADGADSGGGGGCDSGVSRSWRWRGSLSELSRPQSRTVRPGTGTATAAGCRNTARTRSRWWRHSGRADDGRARLLLAHGSGYTARIVHACTEPWAARRRAGAKVAGEPRDRVENLRETARRRRAAYLIHRPLRFVARRTLYYDVSTSLRRLDAAICLRGILNASGCPCSCFLPPQLVPLAFFPRGIDSIPTLDERRLLILAILLPHTHVRSSSIATSATGLRCDLHKRNFFPQNMSWKFCDMLEKRHGRTTTTGIPTFYVNRSTRISRGFYRVTRRGFFQCLVYRPPCIIRSYTWRRRLPRYTLCMSFLNSFV